MQQCVTWYEQNIFIYAGLSKKPKIRIAIIPAFFLMIFFLWIVHFASVYHLFFTLLSVMLIFHKMKQREN